MQWVKAGNDPGKFADVVPGLSPAELDLISSGWNFKARNDQLPPDGDWTTWLMLAGRGAGKTRAGAEWVHRLAVGDPDFTTEPVGRIALIGETFADVREVMIEGVAGLLSIETARHRPSWHPGRRRLEWPKSGAVAQAFSAEDPESLRGPQFGAAWLDELAKWRYADAAWDMLQFGLRLGERPRQLVTTTPRPIPLIKRLIAADGTAVTRATTADNAGFLAPGFLTRIVARYEGTRLGRQELLGELIDDRADALWRRSDIEAARVSGHPELGRIVVAVDPPASERSGVCGIIAAGLDHAGIGYVIADRTLAEVRPDQWAAAALRLYRSLGADALVAEVNQGGDMVAAVMHEVDPGVPVKAVRATRGKWLRAEPVAALYAQGRVRHVGAFPALEDEMCDFGPDGISGGRSPDRVDALVWALTALMLADGGEPKVRGV
jgi:phage terminase large subunit-like protein